ncbi:MAG: hypothetical protein AAGI68_14435 [Planctomycetota bacterium]
MSEPSPTDGAVVRRPDAVATGPTPDGGKPVKAKRKKSWLVRLVGAGIVLVLLLAGLVLALPLVVSSGWGTQRVLAVVNDAVPGTVEVDDLKVGWLSPIEVEGLRYRDEDGVERVSADRLLVESRPIDVLGGLDLGTVRVSGVKAEVVREADEDSADDSEAEDEDADEASEPVAWPEGLRARVVVEDATVRLVSPGQLDVVISTQAPVVVDASDLDEVTAELAVTVVSGRRSGAMTLDASVRGLVDASGLVRPERSDLTLKVGLSAVPTPMIVRLGELPEVLPALIGPVVDVSLAAEGSALSPAATLSVKSERLEVDAAVELTETGLRVDPSATRASWLVLPAALALLTGEGLEGDAAAEEAAALAAVELLEPVRVAVAVERLELPVTDGVPALASAELRGSVSLSETVVRTPGAEGSEGSGGSGDGERVRLTDTTVLVGGEPLGERLAVVASGSAGVVMDAGPEVPGEPWRLGLGWDDPLGEGPPRVSGGGEVPTALVAVLADRPDLPAMLGDRVKVVDLKAGRLADGGATVSGRVEGERAYAAFGASLSGEQVLTLTEPGEAKLPLNPEMVEGYLKLVLPLLVGLDGSGSSATLTLQDEGFRAELAEGFDTQRLAGSGELVLDPIPVTERSALGKVWRALERGRRTPTGELEVRFEPVQFRVADGKLTYADGSLMMGSVRMEFAGGVDLETESALIALDVPAESLRKLLGLKRVADDDALRVRMTGKVDDLKFDTAGLAREVARLAAREAIQGDDPEDELLRGLLDGLLRPR